MTFEEKVAVALHDFAAVAHRGIPPLRYTDGPNCIRGSRLHARRPRSGRRGQRRARPAPAPRRGQRPALASTPEHVALATRIATDGMVLLANRDGLLPLDTGRVGSVAVFGTARDDAQWVMAGSPCVPVLPDWRVTPWT